MFRLFCWLRRGHSFTTFSMSDDMIVARLRSPVYGCSRVLRGTWRAHGTW